MCGISSYTRIAAKRNGAGTNERHEPPNKWFRTVSTVILHGGVDCVDVVVGFSSQCASVTAVMRWDISHSSSPNSRPAILVGRWHERVKMERHRRPAHAWFQTTFESCSLSLEQAWEFDGRHCRACHYRVKHCCAAVQGWLFSENEHHPTCCKLLLCNLTIMHTLCYRTTGTAVCACVRATQALQQHV